MKLVNSKRFFILSALTTLLASNAAIAAPEVIFKDIGNTSRTLKSVTPPEAVNAFIKNIQKTHPDSYKIIAYKNENHYILYLLSGTTWTADKIRIDLDKSGEIASLIHHYQGSLNDIKMATNKNYDPVKSESPGACPDQSVQFLAISAYPGVAAVNESIAIVSEAANKKFKTMTIVDKNADGQTYKNWLSCPNLKGIYTIGHGSREDMLVGNGDVVNYSFFNRPEMVNNYKNTTVVINACQVYNYPMGTNIMYGNSMQATEYARNPGPNAYEYIGGHTNLLMFSSELSSACFMAKSMDGAKMDYDTLKECIADKDIHFQNFGMSNPGKYFNIN